MIQVLKDGKYAPIELTGPLNEPVELRADWILLNAMYTSSGQIRLLILEPARPKR